MAYNPYAEQHGRYDQQYSDAPGFNSYNNAQPHQAYDQGGYDSYGTGGANYGQPTNPEESAFAPGHYKSESTTHYDQGAFARATTGNRPRDLSRWRHEHHGGLWTKGSRGSCIGRFCCCTLMIIVFFIVGILLPLALWTRPPNIIVGNVQATSNGSEIQTLSNGVQINLELPIYVSNPNYFSVSFSSIKADIYYPINNTLIGTGQENDITFYSHSNTNFTFPFSIEYTTTMSSSAQIIADLETKCGIGGGPVSDITVNYDITLALRVLFFTVSPTISNSASFQCPLTASDIPSLTSILLGGG
jgi:LEA14-like dessication related protein